jgi:hypothetical protein
MTALSEMFNPSDVPMMQRNWFPPEFLTGCDVSFVMASTGDDKGTRAFFEHHLVDFQFGIVQAKRPVFGYASYLWSRIAIGNSFVQGTFAIPFKKKFYLFDAIADATPTLYKMQDNSVKLKAETEKWEKASLANKVAMIKNGDLDGSYMELAINNTLFQNGPTQQTESQKLRVNDQFGTGPNGLEILVYYGNAETHAQQAFDALSEIGLLQDADPQSKVLTVHQLHLNQNTQVIRPKGAPVLEQYSFVARNVS